MSEHISKYIDPTLWPPCTGEPIVEALDELVGLGALADSSTGHQDTVENFAGIAAGKKIVLDLFVEARVVLGWYIEEHGGVGMHETADGQPSCPEDDTCICLKAARINELARRLTAIPWPPPIV